MFIDLHNSLLHQVGRRLVPLLVAIGFMLGLFMAPATVNPSQADPLAGVVSIDPSSQDVVWGTTASVDVRSDGLTNIYGAQFTVSFDASRLQLVDANATLAGIQITPGACPAPDFLAANSADNTAGTVGYAATQLAVLHPEPCDGGVIASIEFLCLDTAGVPTTVPITITSSVISGPDAIALEHTVLHGEIICGIPYQLSGAAIPQGHPGDATGVQICLDGLDCFSTGADGYFSLVLPDAESHALTAGFIHHLSAEKPGITIVPGEVFDIGTTALRAGDLNEDGWINILDLVIVGGNFGLTEPANWSGAYSSSTNTPSPTATPTFTPTPPGPMPSLTSTFTPGMPPPPPPPPTPTPTYTPTPSVPTSTPEPPTPSPGAP